MRFENAILTAGQVSRTLYYSVCSGNFAENKLSDWVIYLANKATDE